MKTKLTYFLFALLTLGTITSCSIEAVEEETVFPVYSTGDEIDESVDPDDDK